MSRIAAGLAVREVTASHLATTATSPDAVVTALWHQLAADSSQPPPNKRQKLDHTTSGEENICIANIVIGLTTGDAPLNDYLDDVDPSAAVPAAVLHYAVDKHDHTGSLLLAGPNATLTRTGNTAASLLSTTRDPSIVLRCFDRPDHDKSSAGFHLARISQLSRSRDGSNPNWPLWVHTSLVRRTLGSNHVLFLHSRLYWRSRTTASRFNRSTCHELLATYLLPPEELLSDTRNPQTFYNSVHVPDTKTHIPDAVQHPVLAPQLYPFQRRAVAWLLNREGVGLREDGSVKPLPAASSVTLSFRPCVDATSQTCYASNLLGRVVRTTEGAKSLHSYLSGGILAEEMGLGKTVEMISLMALNPRREGVGSTVFDAYSNANTTASGATLIITPPAILEQWKSEISSHAPSLKVFHYDNSHRSAPGIKQTLLEHDVVLTTYAVLSREIHHANERPKRAMRHEKKYEATKSPLVEILWWRVCLDEAQMIENGVSNAAIVARRIPRCNAWAITGTPVRKDLQDLCGLLIFLRYEPFCELDIWSTMTSRYINLFRDLFGQITLRHTKAQIRQDLRLPLQKRVTVTIPFTAIEEQHYSQMFQQMCDEVGVDLDGGPLHDAWDPEDPATVEKMRTWLTRLRQTCLHPEVGDRNRRALGQRTGPLRTVEAVLDVMIEQNETALRQEERASLNARLVQGHLYSFSKNGEKALKIYQESLASASLAVDECRTHLAAKEAKRALTATKEDLADDDDADTEDDEDKSDALPARTRLRNALELQHVCVFFAATAYYQVKTDSTKIQEGSDEFKELETKESEYYERAKAIRKEILSEATKKSRVLMNKVHDGKTTSAGVLQINHLSDAGGIQSRRIMADFHALKKCLNLQAGKISEWRDKLTELLTVNLLDQDEGVEMTGDEYEGTLKQQDESYAYLFLMRALLADRHEMITGQENFLLQHEVKETLKLAEENEGHAPELTREGLKLRSSFRPQSKSPVSLRAIVADLRGASTAVGDHHGVGSAAEVELLESELSAVQRILGEQMKDVNALTRDLELFRNTMNQRLEYYRQLQAISDMVQPYAEEDSDTLDQTKLDEQIHKEDGHNDKLAGLRTKGRFLEHLQSTKDDQDERRPCIICQSTFEIGVLTVCAHEFCRDCIQMWMSQHRSCPMCKRALRNKDLHAITYKPQQLIAEEEPRGAASGGTDDPASLKESGIYTSMKQQTLDEIRAVDLPRSWGSKVDSIVRHILYLRGSDPGSKAILFSQYRDFLQVLGRALRTCKVGFSDIADKNGISRFKEDASAECFLLHAKAESSGLNLVNATHVFLCEPLINTAIELQAIARVHRIGQRRPTTVWMYLVRDTIEEAIYDISLARRLEHLNAKQIKPRARSATQSRVGTPAPDETESKLDAANSLELETAPLSKLLTKGQSGGEMVRKDDLWSCLFAGSSRSKSVASIGDIEGMMGRELRADAAQRRMAQN